MKHTFKIVISVACLTLSSLSLAAEGLESECDPLETATPMQNYCAGLGFQAADAKLNKTYQQLRSKLTATEKKALTKDELRWISHRDKTCETETADMQGTGWSGFYDSCRTELTDSRIAVLEKQLTRYSKR